MAFYNRTKLELRATQEKLQAAESRIDELEADFRAIEQHTALMVLSRDGLVERVSKPCLELFGYQQEEKLIGKHHRVFCEDDYARGEEYIVFWRELVTGHVKEGQFFNLDAQGEGIWLNASYLPVLSDKGIVKRIVVLYRPG